MSDLKEFLELDIQKVQASLLSPFGLGRLKKISDDPEYWVKLFTYQENRSNLENFLLFRTASSFKLYKKRADDPDCTLFAMNYLRDKLSRIPSVQTITIGDRIEPSEKNRAMLVRTTDNHEFYLESDTGISLMKDVGDFFREILEAKYEGKLWPYKTYMPTYELPKGTCGRICIPYRNFYFYTLLTNTPQYAYSKIENECLVELQKRAGTCHTVDNLILVPYGYNSLRGMELKTYKTCQKINDRIDLTLLDLGEMLSGNIDDGILQNRLGNQKATMKSVHFLLENKKTLFPIVPYYDCYTKGIESILIRTRNINNLFENN